ncbi:hypothetical protein [Burkholderia ambifaria]|uniref:hypothetical protein n=1 Tax=Burkholderia ambifaria TaxID=152480 RepID=UPI00158D4E5F|nr:hypothetical protein [Burkholderia ambifaria]
MTERPILFSGAMVRAILEGRKTQTRRIAKVRNELPPAWATFASEGHSLMQDGKPRPVGSFYWSEEQLEGEPIKTLRRWPVLPDKHPMAGDWHWTPSPYGKIGDRLWVRETHDVNRLGNETFPDGRQRLYAGIAYQADDGRHEVDITDDQCRAIEAKQWRGWTPSIHMPRWASRITLEITGVRVERLNDCSEDDARAEGSEAIGITFRDDADGNPHLIDSLGGPYRDGFRILWERINGAGAWNANPWVWVIQFRRIHGSENR